MRNIILCIMSLMLGAVLRASAFENWILACRDNAIQVSADEFAASESKFLAEGDSLWTAIQRHLEPWDDAFFNARPNPVVLHEGVYLVAVEFSGPQMAPGLISVAGISYATHAGKLLMLNSSLDSANQQVMWTDGPGSMGQTTAPYCFRIAASDLMDELATYQEEVNRVLPEAEASHQAMDALFRIRNSFDAYMRRTGNLQGFTIAAAVKLSGLNEVTLRTWQFSVMTNVGTNVPIRYVATCIREDAPYYDQKVWYDVLEARFHGLGVDGAEWTY